MFIACAHSLQTKKKRRPTSSRQLCVRCMPSLYIKDRRLFVLNERMREKKKNARERDARRLVSLSLNYTVYSFVLSVFFSLLVFFTRQWKMELGYLFSHFFPFNYYTGRHPTDAPRFFSFSLVLFVSD
jgi:hypothetical protein